MIIYFKNGLQKQVHSRIGELIRQLINKEEYDKHQAFISASGHLQLIINIDEIVFIELI
jgi:hypothetical protein